MATTLEIIDGISQVMINTYDGAHDKSGEPIKIGLRREEGNPLIDPRVIDGFGCQVSGDRLHIKYHAEVPLKEVHANGFESEIETMIESIKSFIQKEYKKLKSGSLSLSDPTEIDVLVEYVSRIRCSVKAHKCYKIGSLDSESNAPESKDRLDSVTKDWLALGGLKK
jgi:hypothetical protein